ncbi:uncharacterized protein Z518_03823 [Rhinocladiella mackenziei CBS 650.93]|uniref:Uncharacterized protein n=1 Tax=Rhinocladiella mackenziei CBS 650.93 TaxID=1442369 RepID=A0A0D2J9Q3_9EURO|nr:uncharacterized protein Z518_03823 [Rhinocladiella mackenziei CBS 650.93]KIX05850.1 hypothetical protein Z518_03823 [Rhinocladiella mackenziei CBS 650.93]
MGDAQPDKSFTPTSRAATTVRTRHKSSDDGGHQRKRKGDKEKPSQLHQPWYDNLTEYSERSVSHESDIPVALALVSENFHLLWGGVFLASLWEQFLFEYLLWHCDVTSEFQSWLALAP